MLPYKSENSENSIVVFNFIEKHFSFVLFFQKKVVQLLTLPALLPTEFISDIQDVKRKTVLQN